MTNIEVVVGVVEETVSRPVKGKQETQGSHVELIPCLRYDTGACYSWFVSIHLEK